MTPTQPQLDLAELRRLAEAATPGPWTQIWEHSDPEGPYPAGVKANDDEPNNWILRNDDDLGTEIGLNDAYIAAANPQTILRLLDLLTPGALAAALVEVEDDGWFGPDYTPGRTAEAILAALAERSTP
jgi:hypothetical protein